MSRSFLIIAAVFPLVAASLSAQVPSAADTALVSLSGPETWGSPSVFSLSADSLSFGDVVTMVLEYDSPLSADGGAIASSEAWLMPDRPYLSDDGMRVKFSARVYHEGIVQVVWEGSNSLDAAFLHMAGRLPPDARPSDVRDPRSLGFHLVRIILASLLVLLLPLAWWLIARRGKLPDADPGLAFQPPAWMVVARELWRLEQLGYPSRGEYRRYLHGLDLAFRRYLGLRHDENVVEMTSTEVVEMLRSREAGEEAARTATWLAECDRLRFSANEIRPAAGREMLSGLLHEIEMTRQRTCPENVPGDWQYESEQCWANLLAAVPGWRSRMKEDAGV